MASCSLTLVIIIHVIILCCIFPFTTSSLLTVRDDQFFNPALGVQQSIRVVLPYGTEGSGKQYPTLYFLHPFVTQATEGSISSLLDQTAAIFSSLIFCLTMPTNKTLYCNSYEPDLYCSLVCLSEIDGVGWTGGGKLLYRMNLSTSAKLPFIQPLIVVLADYRSGFYTNRHAGAQTYFPPTDRADRAGRLLQGSTGAYEAAIVQVAQYVDIHYPTTFDRVLLGQGMGGYGAAKVALKYPEIFLAAAVQNGNMNQSKLLEMYDSSSLFRQSLNQDFPGVFDVFGPGTFDISNGKFPLPSSSAAAFDPSFVTANSPADLLGDARIPFYLEVGEAFLTDSLTYNTTYSFCKQLQRNGSPGEAYLDPDSEEGYPAWFQITLGRAISFLLRSIYHGENMTTPTCDSFLSGRNMDSLHMPFEQWMTQLKKSVQSSRLD